MDIDRVMTVEPHAARAACMDDSTQRDLASEAMSRYAAGDDRAFAAVYELLSPRLYRFCIFLVGRAEAADIVQEVFLKMHRARASFIKGGSVIAWSFAIARTTAIDRSRRRRRRPEEVCEPERIEMSDGGHSASPEDTLFGVVMQDVVENGLQMLSEALRPAYVLVRLEGMSCAEAAEILGCTVSAVKQRVHRASEELRVTLQSKGWEDSV